jgi:hypothetical protein
MVTTEDLDGARRGIESDAPIVDRVSKKWAASVKLLRLNVARIPRDEP